MSGVLRHVLPLAAETQQGSTAVRILAWIALAIAFACVLAIAWDSVVAGYRQHMTVMDFVYPITALYWGPVALRFYFTRGRRMSHKWANEHGKDMDELMSGDEQDPPSYVPFAKKNWWPISKGTAHCGAGCTLGDIVGEWLVFAAGWAFAFTATHKANVLFTTFVFDFAFAWSFGIVFQYFSIVPMRENVGKLEGVWLAIKADTLSIVAFQVGLFGYMAIYHLLFWDPPLSVASAPYWWMMQIGMIIGFFTAWPVNTWLIRRGWKEKM